MQLMLLWLRLWNYKNDDCECKSVNWIFLAWNMYVIIPYYAIYAYYDYITINYNNENDDWELKLKKNWLWFFTNGNL